MVDRVDLTKLALILKLNLCVCVYIYVCVSIYWNDRLDEVQIAEKNINNLRYADDTTLIAESKEELKSLLMKVKEESEKAGLKLNSQNTKARASSPITFGK